MFDLKVGFTCNNDCIHCVVGDKRNTEDLTLQEIKEIVDKITLDTDNKETEIQLTGGEISIRKDFLEILKYCKKKNLRVSVQTNGTGFANETLVKEAKCYIDMVLIAIHSCYPDIHNTIVGHVKDSKSMFDLTMKGLDNLIKYNIPFQTQTVISSLNISTLYDTYNFLQAKAPGVLMHLTYPHPMGNAHTNRDVVVPKYSSIKKYIIPIVRDFGNRVLLEAIPPCYIFPYYLNIAGLIDSDVKHNQVKRQGFDKSCGTNNLFKEGFTENYNINDITSRKKATKCLTCFYTKECAGVWKEYIDYNKSSLDLFPIKELDTSAIDSIFIKASNITDIDFSNLQKFSYKRNIITLDQIDALQISEELENFNESFYMIDISNIDISFIESLLVYGIDLYFHISEESHISKFYQLQETISKSKDLLINKDLKTKSNLYLDVELSIGTENIMQVFNIIQDTSTLFKGISTRLVNTQGFCSEDSYKDIVNSAKFIASYVHYNNLIVSFVNIPSCFLNNHRINKNSLNRYSIINNLKEVRLEFSKKVLISNETKDINSGYTESCSNCILKNVCLGFNDHFPIKV